MRLVFAFAVLALTVSIPPAHADPTAVDPFLWLEQVDGARARAWVRAQNDVTLKSLASHPTYEDTRAAALSIVTASTQYLNWVSRDCTIISFWIVIQHRDDS